MSLPTKDEMALYARYMEFRNRTRGKWDGNRSSLNDYDRETLELFVAAGGGDHVDWPEGEDPDEEELTSTRPPA